jgi:uncharacterized protein (DUF1015 family)
MSDPGLVLLPTHRIIGKLPYPAAEITARLENAFDLTPLPNAALADALASAEQAGTRALAIALSGGNGYLLTPKDESTLLAGRGEGESERLKGLDVTVLHSLILEKLLGLTGLDEISYTRDPMEAIASVERGSIAAFLMNAPTVDDMRVIALGGERMPQKSTYYFPKILSGLVMWSLNDFE